MIRFSKPARGPFNILYVDDEQLSLKYFQEIVGEDYNVLTASSAEEGLKVVGERHASIGVVVSDQKLGGMQGTAFLTKLREQHPEIVRVLATGYSDMNAVIAAINDGAIFHYIHKPWDPQELVETVKRAAAQFLLRADRDRLLSEKTGMVRDLMMSDRMAGYGVLAEGINHHLRNALVPVEAYLQISGQEPEAPGGGAFRADAELLGQLRSTATTQVRRIIDLLGRLSSIQGRKEAAGEDEVFVQKLWNEVVAQLSDNIAAKGVEITSHCDGDLPPVMSSRDRLAQVCRLVIEDALERLPSGGSISVSIARGRESENGVEHICLEVSDSGSDLDDSRLASVFTPFSMRRDTPQYVGLDLPTAYVTLCGLGGWAKAYNDPERGTVIALSIPLSSREAASKRPQKEAIERVLGGGEGVLVAH